MDDHEWLLAWFLQVFQDAQLCLKVNVFHGFKVH